MHELVQAAMFADDIHARAEHQMKRIAENNLGSARRHFFRRDAFDRAVGAYWHERGRLYIAATKLEPAAARRVRSLGDRELHAWLPGVRNMASP